MNGVGGSSLQLKAEGEVGQNFSGGWINGESFSIVLLGGSILLFFHIASCRLKFRGLLSLSGNGNENCDGKQETELRLAISRSRRLRSRSIHRKNVTPLIWRVLVESAIKRLRQQPKSRNH